MRRALAAFALLLLLSPARAAEKTQDSGVLTPEGLFAAALISAEKGQSRAMITVGLLYEQGLGVPRNFSKAMEWYENAANAGEAEGWLRLGIGYEIGMGVQADLRKAADCYDKSAQLGSTQGKVKMASLHLSGRGRIRDEAKGLNMLWEASQAGDGAARNELGVICLKGLYGQKEDPVNAGEYFRWGAEVGNVEAMKNLAIIFKDGLGRKADPAEALRCYLSARKAGFRSEDMDEIVDGLKRKLSAAQVQKAEAEASAWAAAWAKRSQNAGQQ